MSGPTSRRMRSQPAAAIRPAGSPSLSSHATYLIGGVHRCVVSGPANTQWPSATFSAAAAIIYRSDGANLYVIAQIDFGGVKTSSGGTFQITWDARMGYGIQAIRQFDAKDEG